jgi:hypothetical protein
MRGAYYKERSTRVRQPMIDAELEAGPRGTVDAHFLVDEITSASSATGNPNEFTELRWEVGIGYRRELGSGRAGAAVRYSQERDYVSFFGIANGELDLAEKNTTLRLVLGLGHDEITNGVAVDAGGLGTPRLSEELDTYLGSLTLKQLVSPDLVASLTYDVTLLDGYQANIYRVVFGGMSPVPERVPDRRLRHALFGALRAFACPTRTTAFVGYRFYADDWGIVAHTPEVRLIQDLTPGLQVRARYRFHTETAADFFKDVYSQDEVSNAPYVTDDEKLSAHTTHLFGLQLSSELGLLGVRGTWAAARIDAVVEYMIQSTSFGNAVIASIALAVPIRY